MKVFKGESIRKIENACFSSGITEFRLMENAGSACAKAVRNEYELETNTSKSVVILCGKGKNGGDGFVMARKFKEIGLEPLIIITHDYPSIREPLEMFEKTRDLEIRSLVCRNDSLRCLKFIADADIIIDCIFGIGYHGIADERTRDIFKAVNDSSAQVVSIDVPSGLDSEGKDFDPYHIRADLTISITALKPVHILNKTSDSCGKVRVVNINIPEQFINAEKPVMETLDGLFISERLPNRDPNSNKGTFGHLLCLCGSYRMPGAAIMSAKAAERSGVGKITLAFPKDAYNALTAHLCEPMFMPLSGDENGYLDISEKEKILNLTDDKSAVLLGCGLGRTEAVKSIVNEVIKKCSKPVIIDADGINAISDNINILDEREEETILTPHAGEMACLLGKDIQYVLSNRRGVAEEFCEKYQNCVLVLKGKNTIVAKYGKPLYINTTGNAGLSQGGTGDVLAGLMAGFTAQGMSALNSALCAVFIHGEAGDICAKKYSQRGMTTLDVIDTIPSSLKKYCWE